TGALVKEPHWLALDAEGPCGWVERDGFDLYSTLADLRASQGTGAVDLDFEGLTAMKELNLHARCPPLPGRHGPSVSQGLGGPVTGPSAVAARGDPAATRYAATSAARSRCRDSPNPSAVIRSISCVSMAASRNSGSSISERKKVRLFGGPMIKNSP